jgi:pilus assembly protein Flp/PilA
LDKFLAIVNAPETPSGQNYGSYSEGRQSMLGFLKRFASNEAGATAIEYALISAPISVAIIAGATTIGTKLGTTFTNIGSSL